MKVYERTPPDRHSGMLNAIKSADLSGTLMERITEMKYLIALLMVAANGICGAKDIYVSQVAKGVDSGVDAANAHPLAWLNDPLQWGTGSDQVAPGDTVHLVGTFTGNPIGPNLTVQGNGAPGSPITILFEDNASFMAPTFLGSIISFNKKNYITVDGGKNGVLWATNNGALRLYKNNITGVRLDGSHDVLVCNLSVKDLNVRSSQDTDWSGIGVNGQPLGSNTTISNLVVSWCETGIFVGYNPGSVKNLKILNTITTNSLRGFRIGDGGPNSILSDVTIAGCKFFGNYSYWNPTPAEQPSYGHAESGQCFSVASGSVISNLHVFANTCAGPWSPSTTGTLFFEEGQGKIIGIRCYNNLITESANLGIYHKGREPAFFANNTIRGPGNAFSIAFSPNDTFLNNVSIGCATFLYNSGGAPTLTIDYNVMYNSPNPLGQNLNGKTVSPALDNNYRPMADSPVIGSGTNLSAFFAVDIEGNLRTGTWDVGAFEHGATEPLNQGDTIDLGISSGSISGPFEIVDGVLSQPVTTYDGSGGSAVYSFRVSRGGDFLVKTTVSAGSGLENSCFVNIDAAPDVSTMIWDIEITSGFEERIVSWRGTGAEFSPEFKPKVFRLGEGQHLLFVLGREANVKIQRLAVVRIVSPPGKPRLPK